MKRTTLGLAAAASAVALLAASGAMAASGTVAFLMPDQASTRYEQHDFPGFKAEMEKLCPDCTVIYQNANADAALQQQQFNSVLTQGAKVVVLDPVDSKAASSMVKLAQSQGAKVIAYDRPIPDVPADYYVSFDNQGIGKAISESLVKHLEAQGVAKDKGGILRDQRLADRRGRGPDPRRRPRGPRRQRLQDARRVRHPRVGAAQGAGVDERPDPALRRRHPRHRRGQRRHRRRRDRGAQGGRRQPAAAGDRQRRDDRGAAADHLGRPVQHDLQALRDRGGRSRERRGADARRQDGRSRRPRSTTRRPSSSSRPW